MLLTIPPNYRNSALDLLIISPVKYKLFIGLGVVVYVLLDQIQHTKLETDLEKSNSLALVTSLKYNKQIVGLVDQGSA